MAWTSFFSFFLLPSEHSADFFPSFQYFHLKFVVSELGVDSAKALILRREQPSLADRTAGVRQLETAQTHGRFEWTRAFPKGNIN